MTNLTRRSFLQVLSATSVVLTVPTVCLANQDTITLVSARTKVLDYMSGTCKYLVAVSQGSNMRMLCILVSQDGDNVYSTEFNRINIGDNLDYSVDFFLEKGVTKMTIVCKNASYANPVSVKFERQAL